MKKYLVLLMLVFTSFIYANEFPQLKKTELVNGKPWWYKTPSPIEGVSFGVGVARKLEDATAKAKADIALNKKSNVKASVKSSETVTGIGNSQLHTSRKKQETVQETDVEISGARSLDKWEDPKTKQIYVWVAELDSDEKLEKVKKFVLEKNIELETSDKLRVKYKDKIRISDIKKSKYLKKKIYFLDAGKNAGLREGDVLQVYKLDTEIKDELGKTIDYTKKEMGKLVIIKTSESSSEAEEYGLFSKIKIKKIKENFIVENTGNNDKIDATVAYKNKLVITQKKSGKYLLNAGKNKNIRENEVFIVYKLGEPIKDPSTGKVVAYTKKKKGKIYAFKVYDEYTECKIYGNFLGKLFIKKDYVLERMNQTKNAIKSHKKKIKDSKEKVNKSKYKVIQMEKAKALSGASYNLALYSTADDLNGDLRVGIFSHLDLGIGFNTKNSDNNTLNAKISVPVFIGTAGVFYSQNFKAENKYIGALFEHELDLLQIAFSGEYKYFLENEDGERPETNDTLAFGIEYGPILANKVLLGAEFITGLGENEMDNLFSFKVDVELTKNLWLGVGRISSGEDNEDYYIKLQKVGLLWGN